MAYHSVAAVIVTFNRYDKLKLVVSALQEQSLSPGKIFVIDNASTDETEAFLSGLQNQDDRFVHVRLPQNIGGAGGFYEGAKIAYEAGFEYVWFSDDDAYPEPRALQILLESIEDFSQKFSHRPSFACSAVKWMDGTLCEMNTPSTVWDWPRFYSAETPYFLVGSCSFVSVLVPRWVIKKHGYPIKDYFLWYDDAEFTYRIARTYPGIYCPESIVVHDIPENKGVNYTLVRENNVWKYCYGARNEASFRLREHGIISALIFLRGIHRQMRQGQVPFSMRQHVYRAFLRGCVFSPNIEKPVQ